MSIVSGFLKSARQWPKRPALEIGGRTITYAELCQDAMRTASTLVREQPRSRTELTAVFGERSEITFAGILGSLMRGHGYVPINPQFPVGYCRDMLEQCSSEALIVDEAALQPLPQLLSGIERPLTVLLPNHEAVAAMQEQFPSHRFVTCDAAANELIAPEAHLADAGKTAYLLFTSGSTGKPKGVMVPHRAVRCFIQSMVQRYEVTEQDRFSQMSQFTFDLSAFDMFVAWEAGACVCCPGALQMINPGPYIEESRLTVWFSVPSVGKHLRGLKQLAPEQYSGLRLSLFCGEPLPADLAQAWAAAAPNSIVENLYGPTELTIACTLYRWDPVSSPAESENGIVPIGWPYPDMIPKIVDDDLREVQPGEVGELVMTGPQLSLGYLDNPEKTAEAFVSLPGTEGTFYRTGDRVRRPVGDGPLQYIGRRDHQVKIHGLRAELGEIEAALRQIANVDTAIAVGWPRGKTGIEGIVAFVSESRLDAAKIRSACRDYLPAPMIPRTVRFLDEFPLNSNGKVDRKALLGLLENTS